MQQKTFTYQTRVDVDEACDEILRECAQHFSRIQRCLFKDYQRGKNFKDLKSDYLRRYQITARQFNSCRIELEGMISSYKELLNERIPLLKAKIKRLEKHIRNLQEPIKIHQKKRRCALLQKKLESLEKDKEEGKVRLCFGSKKLFHAQFHLEKNGYKDLQEWKQEWTNQRNSSFFLVGSKDESRGNQSSQLFYNGDTFSLKIRLPNLFSHKTITISNITFNYGKEEILQALEEKRALSYRWKKDRKGWRVFVSLTQSTPTYKSRKALGTIGVDINANSLAVVETDRFGNPIKRKNLSLPLYGKNKNQRRAIIGEVSKKVVEMAAQAEKPIVLETLNFQKKKQTLRESSNKYSRMLSSFCYHKLISNIESRAWRKKIQTYTINPAYTSIIGRIKFARRYGLSTHQAAALTIARRLQRYSERPPRCLEEILDNKGNMIAFSLPARNREKHVWSFYGKVKRKLTAVLAAHARTKKLRSLNTIKTVYVTMLLGIMGEAPIRESLTKLFG